MWKLAVVFLVGCGAPCEPEAWCGTYEMTASGSCAGSPAGNCAASVGIWCLVMYDAEAGGISEVSLDFTDSAITPGIMQSENECSATTGDSLAVTTITPTGGGNLHVAVDAGEGCAYEATLTLIEPC